MRPWYALVAVVVVVSQTGCLESDLEDGTLFAGGPGIGGGAPGGAGGAGPSVGGASPVAGAPVNGGATAGGTWGGAPGLGGAPASTGGASAGVPAVGGTPATGGAMATGGVPWTGGVPSTGGVPATGGVQSTGGIPATGGVPATGGSSSSDPFEAARQACVDRINAFRATEGKAPYARWVEGEACADEESRLDGLSNDAHGSFGMCDERAQNSCLWRRSMDSIITNCLQAMWDEGPGEPFSEHGHYINMSSTSYTRVACGFYQGSDGRIWGLQNFR